MGNLPFPISLFQSDSTKSDEVVTERFVTKRVCNGVSYYYTPVTEVDFATVRPAKDSQTPILCSSIPALPLSDLSSAESSVSPLLSDPASHPASTSRPLLVFFGWLGAQPGAVAKYRDLYLDRGMDVLLVQSRVTHFLWPRWGFSYGLEILNILKEPPFSGRDIVVHSCSIGGYTFTQMLRHIAEEPKLHADVAQRVSGHVYDSLVVGTLEHMATGLGKTLMPRLEGLVRNLALLYFRLFKAHTADLYEQNIHVFYNSPVTCPTLFFYSENDALCSLADLQKLFDFWRQRGVTVASRKWKESIHAAHLRCHPEEYVSTLQHYLNSI
ncbi:uncharacterized protein LOC106514772 [Austrofundulus limnaeus]|uniref:Uncharacterized protein LOC106514772 n=1 Tax=Austrofundulus limnaeus TaxID=52670 RepID=A0A2I4AVY1_AUSLI|nr:PREDICTED: uncharacterized protein LOC106514772 [Austrofundulus limnaeus]